jgi:hypothetical protein
MLFYCINVVRHSANGFTPLPVHFVILILKPEYLQAAIIKCQSIWRRDNIIEGKIHNWLMIVLAKFDTRKFMQMKVKFPLVIAALLIIAACKKDTFQTKPQLSFKKVNSEKVTQGDILRFTLEVTDKEGDVDTFFYRRMSKVCATVFKDSVPSRMPDGYVAEKNLKATFEVNFVYGVINGPYPIISLGCTNKNDTSFFKFWVKDKAGNVSDTATSPYIVFLK